jgi:hypothetical protein
MTVQRTIAFNQTRRIRGADSLSAKHAGKSHFFPLARRTVLFAQSIAHLGQQWVMRTSSKVGNID